MLGISGTALGAILRAYGVSKRESWQESYKDLAAIAGVWAIFVLISSFLILFFGTTPIGTLLAWLPASVTAGITATGFGLAAIGSLLVGFGAFVSMFVGALVMDLALSIKKSI